MVEYLMEELRRLDLGAVFARNHTHGRLEHLAHPVGGHDFKILAITPRGGAVGVQIVEQTAGLVLLHVKTGQSQQLAVGVAGVHHARTHQHALAVLGGLHFQLVHVEAQFVELVDALFDLPHLVRAELVGVGQRAPQRMVAVHQAVSDFDFVHVARQQCAGRQIHQFADDVRTGQIHIVFTLAFGEVHLQIAGFGVHQERGESVGVTQEQHVRQGHIAPIEAGQVQTHHQHGKRVDESFGGVGTQVAGEQRAVRQREFQMLGDQDGFQRLTLRIMAAGDHGDRLHGRQFQLLQSAQQLVFAFRHVACDFLHGVDFVAHMHETHHVPGDASRQVDQQVLRPCCQRLLPRQREHLRIRARRGDLQRLRLRALRCGVLGLHGSGLKHTGIHLWQFM